MARITQRDFDRFKKECEKQLEHYGLRGWQVYFNLVHLEGRFADVKWSVPDRVATISLSTIFPKLRGETKSALLLLTAKHEVLHLFLARIRAEAVAREFDRFSFDDAEHEVIRVLEKE